MKKITFGSLLVIVALLLSSCQFHTGLGSLLGGKKSSSSASGVPTKHIKATHTPPSPKTPSAGTVVAPTTTPASRRGFHYQRRLPAERVDGQGRRHRYLDKQ